MARRRPFPVDPSAPRALRTSALARPYRVLNLDPTFPRGVGARSPVAMLNEVGRWCLTEREATDYAAYATRHGYRVEIVLAQEPRP